jgi:hypothetical protein
MALSALRFVTLVLAALSLTMESAHVLEMPQKLQYDPQLYTAVNGSLYLYFAIAGGIYQVGAIIAAALLTIFVRRHPALFRPTMIGAGFLIAAFLVWAVVVSPINQQIAMLLASAPAQVPERWMSLRYRWEFGHAAGFLLQLTGYAALFVSVLAAIPRQPRPTAVKHP